MASSPAVSIQIGAADKASPVVAKVSTAFGRFGNFAQGLTAPSAEAAQRVDRVSAGFGALRRRVGGVVEGVGRFAPALAGITGALSLGGIAELVTHFAQFGSNLGFAAQRSGIAVSHLNSLQGAAELAGSSADALTSGLQNFGDGLQDAVAGRNPELAILLTRLGISFRDATTGGARTAGDVLPQLAHRIAAVRNPIVQARLAVLAFGSAAESLLPLFRRSGAGIGEYIRLAQRYGVMTDEGVERANQMRRAQTQLGLAFTGLGSSIAEGVTPVLAPMLTELADFVGAGRADMAGFIGDIANEIEKWAKGGGTQEIINFFKDMYEWGLLIVGVIGDLITILHSIHVPKWLQHLLGVPDSRVPLSHFTPEQRRLLGLPDAPRGGGPATKPAQGGASDWCNQHAPEWLGGHCPHVSPLR